MNRPKAAATVLVEDERVTVTRFVFAPGAETGWHVHGHDYAVTAITDCEFLLQDPDGASREVDVGAGGAYRRSAGVEHNVVNRGTQPMTFVETELTT
ncbi:MAG: cupin domain-containing protein [Sulfitobacter sp.]